MALDKNEIFLQLGVTMLTVAASTAVTIYVTQHLTNKKKDEDDDVAPNPPPFMLGGDDKLEALEKKIDQLSSNPAPSPVPMPVAAPAYSLEPLQRDIQRNNDTIQDLREAMYRADKARFSH